MAKKQSILRDAVDLVFAPAQYLTHDGAAYASSRYRQIFNRVMKPEYKIGACTAAFSIAGLGVREGLECSLGGLVLWQVLSTGLDFLAQLDPEKHPKTKIEGKFFDTEATVCSFVQPEMASALKDIKSKSTLILSLMAGASVAFIPVIYAFSPDANILRVLPLMALYGSAEFGDYWRSKQVLDGNWSLLDGAPPEEVEPEDVLPQPL